MNDTIFNFLDEKSADLLQAVLAEGKEEGSPDPFDEAEQRALEIGQEIKSSLNSKDSLAFARELTGFLDETRKRALQANRLREEIKAKEALIDEAEFEKEQLSSGRAALAEVVNETASKYEEARHAYGLNEFRLTTLADRVVMRRSELTALRRQLKELTSKQGEGNHDNH